MAIDPSTPHERTPKLNQQEIDRLAHVQRLRALRDTDEHGVRKEGLEHSADVAEIAGRMAVIETQQPTQPQFGDDDTEDFYRAQLDGGIFTYD